VENERVLTTQFPIAEDFHSLQGEGQWVGTPMHFIRLAGCSVGKPVASLPVSEIPILKTGEPAWLCHTYDGRPFWCDTDFQRRRWMSFDDLLSDTYEEHICLTGGEPLMHLEKVDRFIELANERNIMIHIETSGTIKALYPFGSIWISVSPKQNALPDMLESADEIKLLVDKNFDLTKIPPEVYRHENVYIQPINDELMVSKSNFDFCMHILKLQPNWKLSIQQHKLLGLR
jgi:7-carboxy-7-deazaguanine synthase